MMLLALIGLSAFAITNSVSIGSFNFTFAMPDWFLGAANIFRGSGRFFWPVFYVILLAIVFLTIRGHRSSVATTLLAIALAIQIGDTSAAWLKFRERYAAEPASAWPTEMHGRFWNKVGSKYEEIRRVLPQAGPPHWPTIGTFAVKHGMGTDLVHLARVNASALERARAEARTAIETGEYDPKALYVIDEHLATIAAYGLRAERDLLARIDDLIVVAPGWKACPECPQPRAEITLEHLLPRLQVGETASFTGSSPALGYLVRGGWQEPSEWGTWSSADRAEMVVPVGREASRISIDARAYVKREHRKQRVLMTVNNVPIDAITLRNRSGNTIDILLPEAVRQDVAERGAVHIEFEFPDATTPVALGISEDGRTYAFGIMSITAR
jgi:hypothetical protein